MFLIYRDEPLSLVAGSNGGFEPFTRLFEAPFVLEGRGGLLEPDPTGATGKEDQGVGENRVGREVPK